MSKRKTIRISEILARINLHVSFRNADGEIEYSRIERHFLENDLSAIASSELDYFDTVRSLLFFCDILTEKQSHAIIDERYNSSYTPIQRYVNVLRLFNEYLG